MLLIHLITSLWYVNFTVSQTIRAILTCVSYHHWFLIHHSVRHFYLLIICGKRSNLYNIYINTSIQNKSNSQNFFNKSYTSLKYYLVPNKENNRNINSYFKALQMLLINVLNSNKYSIKTIASNLLKLACGQCLCVAEPDHSFLEEIGLSGVRRLDYPMIQFVCTSGRRRYDVMEWQINCPWLIQDMHQLPFQPWHFKLDLVSLLFSLFNAAYYLILQAIPIISLHKTLTSILKWPIVCVQIRHIKRDFFPPTSNVWMSPQQISSLILELRVFILPR